MEKRPYNPLKKYIDNLMGDALKNQVFTACSVGFFERKTNTLEGNVFNYGFAEEGQRTFPVDEDIFFDLASLTKPLVISLGILALLEEKKLHIEDKISSFFKTLPSDKKKITLLHLLNHCSGLPAHQPYYKKLVDFPQNERTEKLIEWILAEKLSFEPGDDTLYSDLGFIILGKIIEKISGESLDTYWSQTIAKPLGLEKGLFYPSKKEKDSFMFIPTSRFKLPNLSLYGQVNDDNCRAVGGVSGHAGLFGSAEAVLSLCENILLQFQQERKHPCYSSETMQNALSHRKGAWRFGFDTPTRGISSSGKYFSDLTVGHLGFTGTSFWIDLQRGIAIVVLTNRVLFGEALTPIRIFRPLLHDTIMEYIIKKPR
ncbi:MAG: serine hydrolase [Desulforhopalus sp.]